MHTQGLHLCRLFYDEVVRPVIDGSFPKLSYAAALIGRGSEVLGLDDEASRDHDWGPRVMLFVSEEDCTASGRAMQEALNQAVPLTFRGYRVDLRSDGLGPHGGRHCCYCTEILTLRDFILSYLNFDIDGEIEVTDWLTFSEQKLRGITAGAVYHDEIGLQALRDRFAYYPRDVWLYMLTAGWSRIAQEEHLMGRAGSAGDEIGSAVMASRLVRDLMRLCFLMEKQYAPYPKWYGTAFGKLKCGRELTPILRDIHLAKTWKDREKRFAAAWEHVGAVHNALGIAQPLQMTVSAFHTRPYMVCNAGEFGEAIRARIKDPALSRLASRGLFGGIDQWSDSTAILDNAYWRHALRKLYELGSMEYLPDYGRIDT
jgi:hypothetical protein